MLASAETIIESILRVPLSGRIDDQVGSVNLVPEIGSVSDQRGNICLRVKPPQFISHPFRLSLADTRRTKVMSSDIAGRQYLPVNQRQRCICTRSALH